MAMELDKQRALEKRARAVGDAKARYLTGQQKPGRRKAVFGRYGMEFGEATGFAQSADPSNRRRRRGPDR